ELGQLRAGQLAGGERGVDAGNRRLLETERALLRACWRDRNGQHRSKTDEVPEFPHDRLSWWEATQEPVEYGLVAPANRCRVIFKVFACPHYPRCQQSAELRRVLPATLKTFYFSRVHAR